jgi:hypothetical protein
MWFLVKLAAKANWDLATLLSLEFEPMVLKSPEYLIWLQFLSEVACRVGTRRPELGINSFLGFGPAFATYKKIYTPEFLVINYFYAKPGA